MGKVVDDPVPSQDVVAALLARAPGGSVPDATPEQLAAWRTDPEILAYLSSLRCLQLGGEDGIVWLRRRDGRTILQEDVNFLEYVPSLTELHLFGSTFAHRWRTFLSRDGWQALGGLADLQSLSLRDFNSPTCSSIEEADSLGVTLQGLTRLVELDLRGSHVSPGAMNALANALRGLTQLEDLQLPHNAFCVEGALALANSLEGLSALRRLGLAAMGESVCESPDAMNALANALRALTQLEDLQLSHNPFCMEGASALGATLNHLTRLTELRMGYNWASNDERWITENEDRSLPARRRYQR